MRACSICAEEFGVFEGVSDDAPGRYAPVHTRGTPK